MSCSDQVREALESARSNMIGDSISFMPRKTYPARERVRAVVYAVVRELPDDMTIAELRDELDIAENQVTR